MIIVHAHYRIRLASHDICHSGPWGLATVKWLTTLEALGEGEKYNSKKTMDSKRKIWKGKEET